MIRDKIVFSVKEKTLKERLLREDKLLLSKTRDMCLAFEITQTEVKSMSEAKPNVMMTPGDKAVHHMRKSARKKTFKVSNSSQGDHYDEKPKSNTHFVKKIHVVADAAERYMVPVSAQHIGKNVCAVKVSIIFLPCVDPRI